MAVRLAVLAVLVAASVVVALPSPSASASAPAPPGNCGAATTTSRTNTTATPLADNAVTTSTIDVSGLPPVLGDVDVLTDITHTTSNQLDITLTSPAGTVVTLTSDNGGGSDNVFAGTRWDDDAAPGGAATATFFPAPGHAQTHPYVNSAAPLLAPEEPLGALIGENPNGIWTLRISDDAAGVTGTLGSWGLDVQALAAAPPAVLGSSYAETPGTPIPAAGQSLVTDQIDVAGEPAYLGDVDVMVDIPHTFSSDLQIALTSPAGTTVYLTTGIWAPGVATNADNVHAGTQFDDDANPDGQVPYTTNTGHAGDHPFADLSLASPLAPIEALSAFRGENPNGTWTLAVADQFNGEGGTLDSWSLVLRSARCAVPDTAIASGPAASSTVGATDATFTFDSVPAGVATGFECSLDGDPFVPCTSGHRVSGLANGVHVLQVAALGDGGDRDLSPATRIWKVNVPAQPQPPPPVLPPAVGVASGTPPRAAVRAPSVSGFTVRPRRPRAGRTLTLRWRLSKAGSVTVVLERRVRGRFRTVGRVTRTARAGAGSLRLRGRIGTKKLPAGSYRARITATAPGAAKPSAARTLRFSISAP